MQWIIPPIISNLCIIIHLLKKQKLDSQTSDPGYRAGSGDETTSITCIEEKEKKNQFFAKRKIYHNIHVLVHVCVVYIKHQFQRNLVKNIIL